MHVWLKLLAVAAVWVAGTALLATLGGQGWATAALFLAHPVVLVEYVAVVDVRRATHGLRLWTCVFLAVTFLLFPLVASWGDRYFPACAAAGLVLAVACAAVEMWSPVPYHLWMPVLSAACGALLVPPGLVDDAWRAALVLISAAVGQWLSDHSEAPPRRTPSPGVSVNVAPPEVFFLHSTFVSLWLTQAVAGTVGGAEHRTADDWGAHHSAWWLLLAAGLVALRRLGERWWLLHRELSQDQLEADEHESHPLLELGRLLSKVQSVLRRPVASDDDGEAVTGSLSSREDGHV